jgi:hypothetical protein
LKINPLIFPIFLLKTGTQGEATDWLGIAEGEFGRMQNRLKQLAECFLSGEPVPRQRKPYKKRIAKIKRFSRPQTN